MRLAAESAGMGVLERATLADSAHRHDERTFEIFERPRGEGPINAAEYADSISHPDDACYRAAIEEAGRTGEFHFAGGFRRGDD